MGQSIAMVARGGLGIGDGDGIVWSLGGWEGRVEEGEGEGGLYCIRRGGEGNRGRKEWMEDGDAIACWQISTTVV